MAEKEVVNPTVDKRIEQFVAIRDRLKALDDEHEEKCRPLKELRDLLTGWMQEFLEKTGSDSIKTAHGTCYSTTRYTASLADPQAFMNFVIENSAWDLINRTANPTAVRDYVAEKGALPPGVNLNALRTVGVRRANGK